jgi:transposase
MTKIGREIIETAYQQGIEAVVGLILELAMRIEDLENQKAKNSKNSDKPPSGDGFGKQTKSLRTVTGKQSGGQEGHNLRWVETSGQVIKHEVKACQNCGEEISEVTGEVVEQRQYLCGEIMAICEI